MTQLDIHTEMHIIPYSNGVKLLRATNDHPTVGEVMDFPCNAYFLNTESTILNINPPSAAACGYISTQDAIGTTVFDVLKKENAYIITNVDKQVIFKRSTQVSEDVMIRNDGTMMSFLTIKAPVYNNKDNIVGIFGCSIMLNNQPLADSLTLISKTGILNHSLRKFSIIQSNIQLTPREIDISRLLIRGKTAKEIGMMLFLSRRTVEHYIENIKFKLNVRSKSELIDMLVCNNLF